MPTRTESGQLLVTVIIPNYNYGRFLKTSIESVLNQTYRTIELIVVDNLSTDESREILNGYPMISKIYNAENLGQAASRNRGIDAARGALIAFLDADDYWEETKLEKQIENYKKGANVVYSSVRLVDRKGDEKGVIHAKHRGKIAKTFRDSPTEAIILCGESSILFERERALEIGLFNDELNSASGWDFFRRICETAIVDYVDEPLVNYRIHESNMSRSVMKSTIEMIKAVKIMKEEDKRLGRYGRREIASYLKKFYFLCLKGVLKNSINRVFKQTR
jgi:glycosyltransferase involved in cell wall biosynthesis